MGIHTGEATRTATGLVGLDVHRAARVAAVGHGGQVLFSEPAAALVRDSLPPGATLTDVGVHRLKDLGRPERIFQLMAAGPDASRVLPPGHADRGPGDRARPGSPCRWPPSCSTERDGVWLVELAAVTDPDDVPSVISAALGIAGPPGRPVLETLVDALVPQDILIVLDNCEHLISACAKAADAITRRCPDQGEWLARLDTDHANLRRATDHAASDPGGTAQLLRFGVALRRYWMTRSRHAEALTLLLPVLARPEAQQDPELFATALVTAAHEASMVDIATARPLGEQALGLAHQLDSGHLLIESLAVLSDIYYCAGEA